jgi:hypothetical protein
LKKNLRGQCPCGFDFGVFSEEKDAIVAVQLHFEHFHNDFLPFGITEAEALSLVKDTKLYRKQKGSSSDSYSVQTIFASKSMKTDEKASLQKKKAEKCVFC